MKHHLYINGILADTADDTRVLFTYRLNDLANPTAVRNAYTQPVTLPHTPTNEGIFSHFVRDDYRQSGTSFDPSARLPFVIYDDLGRRIEQGYAKLDSVTDDAYSVTLFGALGSYLFGLTYRADGEKMTLADLDYGKTTLSHTINRSNLIDAWAWLQDQQPTASPFDIINYAPCYNGIPDGDAFDADKVLVKAGSFGIPATSTDGTPAYNGFVLATAEQPMDEWVARDLRTYLQRPVIKVSAIFDAINRKQPLTKHGTFFTSDYYTKTWLTLPMLTERDVATETTLTDDGEYNRGTTGGWNVRTLRNGITAFNDVSATETLRPFASRLDTTLTMPDWLRFKDSSSFGLLVLEAHSDAGALSYSTAVVLCDGSHEPYLTSVRSVLAAHGITADTIQVSTGRFVKGGSKCVWSDPSVTSTVAAFGATEIRIHYYLGGTLVSSDGTEYDLGDITSLNFGNTYAGTTTTKTIAVRSGITVTQQMLLQGTATPADYLLAICKTFGLYLYTDDDGTHVTDRDAFFRSSVTDLTERIDTTAGKTTQPLVTDTRYLTFEAATEGAKATEYRNAYGRTYGRARYDTGYSFNADAADLLGTSVLRGAVEVLRKDRSMAFPLLGVAQRLPWQAYPHTLSYGSPSTQQAEDEVAGFMPSGWQSFGAYPFSDTMSKAEFRTADGKGTDGANVLLFFDDSETAQMRVSDDTDIMVALNGGNSCWLCDDTMTTTAVPHFCRMLVQGQLVTAALDFAKPAELYVPNVTDDDYSEDATIGANGWLAYLSDRYNRNTRVVRCKLNLRGMEIGIDSLRELYTFGGTLWMLNAVEDYDPEGQGTTTCEFVRVQDPQAYTNGQNY